MADPHWLAYRAMMWRDDSADLDEIMADMSTLSEAHVSTVSEAAGHLLRKAYFGGRLNEYQIAICHVYTARAYATDDVRFPYTTEEVRKHLANLREACKPVAALGLKEEHPRVSELAAMIEELESKWTPEPPWEQQYRRQPSLEDAQWLLDHAKGPTPGATRKDLLAWRCVGYLGNSLIYSHKPLWTIREFCLGTLNAAGLLSDPTFKLLHSMSRSRLPGGKGLDSTELWREAVRCQEIWNDLNHEARVGLLALRALRCLDISCEAPVVDDY